MSFVDEVRLYLKAGDGGNGCVSFRREKFVEFGGPDGGNGGRGGSVLLRADQNLSTLLDLCYRRYISAESGKNGTGRNKSGANGKDTVLSVPVGTQVIDEESQDIVADLDQHGAEYLVVYGGKGGLGNINFKSSTNKVPRRFTYGASGEEKCILLKLKILSDVGIIGMPNAGKSQFLNRCSNADSKVGNYPFTTLRPHLGVVKIDYNTIVMADVPGIIANAHLGVGLGHKFLKHIERCKILVHLIDATNDDVISTYNSTHNELRCYNKYLAQKEEILVLNKCDLLEGEEILDKKNHLTNYLGKEVLSLSINDDMQPILRSLYAKLQTKEIQRYDPFENV